jgi:hypothetical protein
MYLMWDREVYIPVAQIFGLLLSCQLWAENLRIPGTVGKTHTLTAKKETL